MAVNIRNSPIDKRRLSKEDRSQWISSKRQGAMARVKQWRGQQAWAQNSPTKTQNARPGAGGFSAGIGIQHQRLRDEGAKLARSKQLREEGTYKPSLTQAFGRDDPN